MIIDELEQMRLDCEAELALVRVKTLLHALEDVEAIERAFPLADAVNELGRQYAARLRSLKTEYEEEERKARE